VLTDTAVYPVNDLCDSLPRPANCPTKPITNTPSSQSAVVQLASQTATTIHNANHQPVLAVATGATVHDFVTVTPNPPGTPVPGGPGDSPAQVTIGWFLNGTCDGTPAANSGPMGLDGNGQVDATGFPQGPLGAGMYSFKAHFPGTNAYAPSDGPCDPLAVVDANIQITPPTATNQVGTTR
jgi:hypothetical protein